MSGSSKPADKPIDNYAEDFTEIFLSGVPLMDVRAPVEFERGAFPAATNLPLLDDSQREVIGTEYTQHGQDAAIELGNRLATADIKAQRVSSWLEFAQQHPDGMLYCFRGGLRSHISQQWLHEAGIEMPLIRGGYKAMRRFLLATVERCCASLPLICVSGRTGSGKTDLLDLLPASVDLEGLARHRGSTFGHTVEGQPAQIDFENALAIEFLRHEHKGGGRLFLEDESRLIGRISLPLPLQEAMKKAPLLVLEASLEEREERVLRDYIVEQRAAFARQYGDEAAQRFAEFVLGNLDRIRKRLGGVRHQELRQQWQQALPELEANGSVEGFRAGVRCLLQEYYDPMYDYQLSRREGPVLKRGDAETVLEWVKQEVAA